MKTRLSPLVLVLALALSQIAAAPAFGEEGTASGKLTVGGKTTPLTHAYALARKDTFDPATERIFIIPSDVPVPAETLWDDFPGVKMAAAGQLHAVEVEVNADKSISSSAVVHGVFAESQSFQGTPAPAFAAKTFTAASVEG